MCVRVDLLETMASQVALKGLAKMGCTLQKWQWRLDGDLQTSGLDYVCKTH